MWMIDSGDEARRGAALDAVGKEAWLVTRLPCAGCGRVYPAETRCFVWGMWDGLRRPYKVHPYGSLCIEPVSVGGMGDLSCTCDVEARREDFRLVAEAVEGSHLTEEASGGTQEQTGAD